MDIISWLLIGALAGWVATILMKQNWKTGLLANIIIGIVGAFIGGFVMSLIGQTGVTGFNLQFFFVALLGAVILLVIVKAVKR